MKKFLFVLSLVSAMFIMSCTKKKVVVSDNVKTISMSSSAWGESRIPLLIFDHKAKQLGYNTNLVDVSSSSSLPICQAFGKKELDVMSVTSSTMLCYYYNDDVAKIARETGKDDATQFIEHGIKENYTVYPFEGKDVYCIMLNKKKFPNGATMEEIAADKSLKWTEGNGLYASGSSTDWEHFKEFYNVQGECTPMETSIAMIALVNGDVDVYVADTEFFYKEEFKGKYTYFWEEKFFPQYTRTVIIHNGVMSDIDMEELGKYFAKVTNEDYRMLSKYAFDELPKVVEDYCINTLDKR